MSIRNTFVAKSQQKRGLRRELPQPLLPGEIGFCTDTGDIFIGADVDQINSYRSLTFRLYDVTQTAYANLLLEEHVFFVDLPDGQVVPEDIADYYIIAERNVDRIEKESANYIPTIKSRLYLAYIESPGTSVVIPDIGTALPVGNITSVIKGVAEPLLSKGDVLTDDFYTIKDTGAIVTLMNKLEANLGIARVIQNVQVDVIDDEDTKRSMSLSVGDNIISSFTHAEATSIHMDYTMNYNDSYVRSGTLHMAITRFSDVGINDIHDEVGASYPDVYFEVDTTIEDDVLYIDLILRNNPHDGMVLTLDEIRWENPYGCIPDPPPNLIVSVDVDAGEDLSFICDNNGQFLIYLNGELNVVFADPENTSVVPVIWEQLLGPAVQILEPNKINTGVILDSNDSTDVKLRVWAAKDTEFETFDEMWIRRTPTSTNTATLNLNQPPGSRYWSKSNHEDSAKDPYALNLSLWHRDGLDQRVYYANKSTEEWTFSWSSLVQGSDFIIKRLEIIKLDTSFNLVETFVYDANEINFFKVTKQDLETYHYGISYIIGRKGTINTTYQYLKMIPPPVEDVAGFGYNDRTLNLLTNENADVTRVVTRLYQTLYLVSSQHKNMLNIQSNSTGTLSRYIKTPPEYFQTSGYKIIRMDSSSGHTITRLSGITIG